MRELCRELPQIYAKPGFYWYRSLPLSESITAMMVHAKHHSRVPRTPLGVFAKYKSLKPRKFLIEPFSDKAQTTALSFFVPIDASWRAVNTKYILADFRMNRSNNIERVEREVERRFIAWE